MNIPSNGVQNNTERFVIRRERVNSDGESAFH